MANKRKKGQKNDVSRVLSHSVLRRDKRITLVLNEKEKAAIDAYCEKKKLKSKSKFIRELVMRNVMDHFVENYPTLFDKKDMDNITVK